MRKKYFTASDYNKFTKVILDAKIKVKGLVDKSGISNLAKNSDLSSKFATSATKPKLKAEQDKIVKLQAFDSNYVHGKSHFEDDDTQNYSVFQPGSKYFKIVANTSNVTMWKSKGLSDESIKPTSTSDNSLNPRISYFVNARV